MHKSFWHRPGYTLLVVLFVIPLTGAGVDIYVPSLPAITHYFAAPAAATKLTIAAYLYGYGLFQLVFGIASDSTGRKPILLWGLLVLAIASMSAAWAPSLDMLLVLRFIQGVAVATVGTATRAILVDRFEGKAYHVAVNYFTLCWALGPILAPMIGGYLQQGFNWHAPLMFYAIYACFGFVFTLLLPESIKQKHPIAFKRIGSNIAMILRMRMFWCFLIVVALMYSVLTVFNVVGPFIVQKHLGYSPVVYGYIALALGFSWFLGNTLNRFLVNIPAPKRIMTGLIGGTTVGIIMVILAMTVPLTIWLIAIPTWLLILYASFAFPASYAGAMGVHAHIAGTTSSVMGTLMVIGAAIATTISALLGTDSLLPMASAFLVLLVLGLIAFALRGR